MAEADGLMSHFVYWSFPFRIIWHLGESLHNFSYDDLCQVKNPPTSSEIDVSFAVGENLDKI